MTVHAFTDALQQADRAQPATWRSAALVLHGMGAQDRQWVLSRLTPDQREAMQTMVDELRGLAFPGDPLLVREAMERSAQSPPAAVEGMDEGEDDDASLIRSIAQANADRIAPLLVDEPDRIVRRLLRLHAWPWADDVRRSRCLPHGDDLLERSMWDHPASGTPPVIPTLFDREMLLVLRKRLQQCAAKDKALPARPAPVVRLPQRAWKSLVARVARDAGSVGPLLGRGRRDRQPSARGHA
jgi:hypothetical protein